MKIKCFENNSKIGEDIFVVAEIGINHNGDVGIAKEQARAVLPEGSTETTLYMAGTLRSWIQYCQLRMANGTQEEHREIAEACWNKLRCIYPNVVAACEEELLLYG